MEAMDTDGMSYDKLSFISLESELHYWNERIEHTKDYLTYLESMHKDATRRMGSVAMGETEQGWLGNE